MNRPNPIWLNGTQDTKLKPVWVPRTFYSSAKIKEDDIQMFIAEDVKPELDKLEAIKTYAETEFKSGYLIKPVDILKILKGEK